MINLQGIERARRFLADYSDRAIALRAEHDRLVALYAYPAGLIWRTPVDQVRERKRWWKW